MVNKYFHEVPLYYGTTNGENIPYMPEGKHFSVAFNKEYGGVITVTEPNGYIVFDATLDMREILDKYEPKPSETETKEQEELRHSIYEKEIMNSYTDWWTENQREYDSSQQPLEVLTYSIE